MRTLRAHIRFLIVGLVCVLTACSSSGSSAKAGPASTTAPAPSTTTVAPTPVPTTVAFTKATKPLAPSSTTYVFSFASGGRTRSYRLHVPPAAAGGKPLPLVLNLAGATQNGLLQEAQSGMDASSDRDGYLVAYPDGTRISKVLTPDPVAKDAQYGFNAGYCCGDPEHEPRRRCRLPARDDLEHRVADAGRPPPRVRDRNVERRHDGVRDGRAGLDLHRGHRFGVGSGGAARDRADPTGADHGVPQRRRSDRTLRRREERRSESGLLGDGRASTNG